MSWSKLFYGFAWLLFVYAWWDAFASSGGLSTVFQELSLMVFLVVRLLTVIFLVVCGVYLEVKK